MRRLMFCLVFVTVGACNGAVVDDEFEPLDLSLAKAAAIEYALEASDLGTKDLVYVAGPSLEIWDQWCGFDTGEPDVEVGADDPPACDVLDATSFDLPAVYPTGGDSAEEIKQTLAPATVEFIVDRESVIEPFGEGMMVAPIKNDAGLLTIGVLIESEGKVYIAMDVHGQGWLFELTPTGSEPRSWDVQPIAEYVA